VNLLEGQADLVEIVGALALAGGLAHRPDGGQEQGHQDADDRDDHQQLDQGEAPPTAASWGSAAKRLSNSSPGDFRSRPNHGETPPSDERGRTDRGPCPHFLFYSIYAAGTMPETAGTGGQTFLSAGDDRQECLPSCS
jgi:hypothetical protein